MFFKYTSAPTRVEILIYFVRKFHLDNMIMLQTHTQTPCTHTNTHTHTHTHSHTHSHTNTHTHSQTHTHKYPHTHNVAFIFDSSSEHVAHFEEYVFFEIISNLLLM